MTGLLRASALARKDLMLEWRGHETVTAMGTFALLVVLLLGFTLGSEPTHAPVIVWVALGFAAMLGVLRLVQMEVEQQAFETLLQYPGSREDLYWGKWAALVIMLTTLLGILLVVLGVLFNIDLWSKLPALFGAGLLGVIGLAAVGTLFASLVLYVRSRELLMPLLLLPVILPVLLGEVRLTEAILNGGAVGVWFGVLIVFDLLFLLVSPILFDVVVEDV